MAAHWCQSEVRNGGFHQFFTNHTGDLDNFITGNPDNVKGFEDLFTLNLYIEYSRARRNLLGLGKYECNLKACRIF